MYDKELLKGNTDILLLSLIIAERPRYGYDLVKEMERRSDGYFRFKEGTLYPALHRLERAGLVEGRWSQSPYGQQRRYYYPTEKGAKVLEERLSEWRRFARAMNLVIQSEAS